ncbi:efflux RND transporter permease subunit [Rubellimicrobium rubrum]|uniref:Efflux RND transporter permease subunit n=1 Tax=Rubellimicrobium rubrum TaxID=2585369 RepID=A0A5C4N3I5_9RHOB|nr:efflux RND transporter permease subunit [Rubellimicrobium rubrum]TNC51987.1 efflux RND transporter permease subunit [Rubellimicrobium rubrum]
MNFSAWSIRHPIAPILVFGLLLLLGWQSFRTLPITQFPTIDVPVVSISVAQSGAAPAELESQVTREVEDAVAGITGVDDITSTVSDGLSSTVVTFRMEVPTDEAVQDVKDAIDQIRGDLPGDVEEPVVTKVDVAGQAILYYAVSAPAMTYEELSWFVDDTIKSELQGRPGVGQVDRYGGADREIRVELDPARLDAYGITAGTVSAQIRATNANQGAGRADLGSGEQAIRLLGDQGDAERLAESTIALPSGREVRLSDLGTVVDTYEEVRSSASFNGEDAVVFAVFRAQGASEVSVQETVEESLETIRAENPGVSIDLVVDNVYSTYGNYEAAIHTLLEGALLAVLVVLLFLRNWRATMIAAVALPLSAIPTFWAMDLLGFSLNLISFLAITLATGILVDDAIVEIENIQRHIRMGKTPYRAAIDAADEIGLAVVATSFTIVAVFVPVSFMPGIPGQYFRQFGLTVAIAVLFSLLVARLITPLMAAYLMRSSDGHDDHGQKDGLMLRAYLAFVRVTMRVRYLTLLAAFGILGVSLYFMAQIPGSFIPPEDASRITLSVELPPGVALADTEAVTRQIEGMVSGVDGVANVFVLDGSSPTGQRDVRRGAVTIVLDRLDNTLERKLLDIVESVPVLGDLVPDVPYHGRNGTLRPQTAIEAEILAMVSAIPDARIIKLAEGAGGSGRDISYSILSQSEADLNVAVARLEEALRGDPLLQAVSTEGALPRPELQITPRIEEAARLGVTTASIAEAVRVATIGDYDAALAKVSIDDRLIPVRVQLTRSAREDLARIGALRVPTAAGGAVPLNAVADIVVAEGPSVVNRLNRERVATIGANLPPGVALGTATARFNEIVAGVDLPASVRTAESGDAEIQAELFASFANAMLLALMLMLGVLILLFGSVIQPFTILFSLPLAIGGVAAALILTGSAVSMPVLIGILMLMGIVTKNAILLVDFAIEMRAKGMSRFEAVVEAGHKRARPIVMTSIAMSAGMLPSALGVGEGGSFRAPMATAVIGGIIVSTVLSLVIVPSFFLIMDDLQRLISWIFGRFVGQKDEEPEEPALSDLSAGIAARKAEIAALEARLMRLEGEGARPVLHVAE